MSNETKEKGSRLFAHRTLRLLAAGKLTAYASVWKKKEWKGNETDLSLKQAASLSLRFREFIVPLSVMTFVGVWVLSYVCVSLLILRQTGIPEPVVAAMSGESFVPTSIVGIAVAVYMFFMLSPFGNTTLGYDEVMRFAAALERALGHLDMTLDELEKNGFETTRQLASDRVFAKAVAIRRLELKRDEPGGDALDAEAHDGRVRLREEHETLSKLDLMRNDIYEVHRIAKAFIAAELAVDQAAVE